MSINSKSQFTGFAQSKDKMKLTIVLTLKDRVSFTYRWMKYMDDMRCPYRILIADGGKDVAIEDHLSDHKNYPNLDYEYIRYQYDFTIEDFYIKFENVISRVESEYLLLPDNDDFYLLDRIPEIIAFLDTHKDYVGARGNLVNLTLFTRDGKPSGSPSGRHYLAITTEANSIENSSPYERVESLCHNMSKYDYHQNWYCVFRSAPFQDEWKHLIGLPIKEIAVIEVLTNVLMVMSGKIKIMPFPFYIRQSNTSTIGDTLVAGNEFLENYIINNSLSEFRIGIDHFFADRTKEERGRLLRAIAAWLEVFIVNIYMNKRTFSKIKMKIKRAFIFNQYITRIYYRLICLFSRSRHERPVRLKLLEPYILEQS